MAYGVFWGCQIPRRFPHVEAATRLLLHVLDMDFIDLKDTLCCPDPILHQVSNPFDLLYISSFNIALAQAQGASMIITPCNGCYSSLINATERIKNQDIFDKISLVLQSFGLKLIESISIKHIVDVLFEAKERIAKMTIKPLKGLKVAIHPGCHFFCGEHLRDFKKALMMIDEIVRILGAEPIEYRLKTMCCGGSLRGFPDHFIEWMTLRKLLDAKSSGAHCLITSCPLCIMNLEGKQKVIESKMKMQIGLPVMTLQEIIALALGYEPKEIGLQYHIINLNEFLRDFHFL